MARANESVTTRVGAVGVECPECGQTVDVPVSATLHGLQLADTSHATRDRQGIETSADTTALWAHMLTHGPVPSWD